MTRPTLKPYDLEGQLARMDAEIPGPDDGPRWTAHVVETFDGLAADGPGGCPAAVALVGARRRGYAEAALEGVPDPVTTRALGSPEALRAVPLEPGMAVLDLGCGAGLDALLAARLVGPAGRVLGIDLSRGMVRIARAAARQMGLGQARFEVADAADPPAPPSSVDVALLNAALSLLPDPEGALRRVGRTLVPGGAVVVCDAVDLGCPADLRRALSGWGNGVGVAPDRETLRARVEGAGLTVAHLRVNPLGRRRLLEMASATAPEVDRERLSRAIAPLVRRLAGTVGEVTLVARRPA